MTQIGAKHRRAIEALLIEPSITAAAERAGVGRRTLHRWLTQPEFKRELRAAQDAVLASSTAALIGLSEECIETLRDLLASDETADGIKARVALGALSVRDKIVETQVIAERLDEIERRLP